MSETGYAAQLQWELQASLVRLRLSAARARRAGEFDAELARQLAETRQMRHALVSAHADLPMTALTTRLGLSELEADILWFAVADSELRAEPPLEVALTRVVVAAALSESEHERQAALAAMSAEGWLWRTGLLRTRTRDGVETLTTPAFLPFLMLGRRVLCDAVAWCARMVSPEPLDAIALPPDVRARALRLAQLLAAPELPRRQVGKPQHALVTGPRGTGKTMLATALATAHGRRALLVDGPAWGALVKTDQDFMLESLFAEALATGEAIVFDRIDLALDTPDEGRPQPRSDHALLQLLMERVPVPVVFTAESAGRLPQALRDRALGLVELPHLSREASKNLWRAHLPGSFLGALRAGSEAVVGRFALTGRGIVTAAHIAERIEGHKPGPAALEAACALQQGSGMSDTTTRVWVHRTRADLELPERLGLAVDEIIRTERQREHVLEEWGLARKLVKGLGLVCLFDGEPGTGKTLAAEVIAAELDLPLFTVNVANVVSKWIGETEKNLQRVFDDASRNRCLLLFDEADALFSKRTTVERAADRSANMEVNLLLQLVENYRGIVVLTTNLKDAIDPAFARRFAFKLSFELPDAAVRQRVWQNLLPAGKLAPDVDPAALADAFELAGGGIRNVILRAAYRAGSVGKIIDQAALVDCAVDECRALGRLVRTR